MPMIISYTYHMKTTLLPYFSAQFSIVPSAGKLRIPNLIVGIILHDNMQIFLTHVRLLKFSSDLQ